MGTGLRARRLLELAARHHPADRLQYSGLDRFESRSADDGPGLALKAAYRMFRATGCRTRLVPGETRESLALAANHLKRVDLMLVRGEAELLGSAWFYVPRMLHGGSLVFVEESTAKGPILRCVPADEVTRRAKRPPQRRAA